MRTVGTAVRDRSHWQEHIPDWLTLYVVLGMADFGFTLVAFQLGAIEANPFLNHYKQQGLFEFFKISLTLLILCIAYKLRERPLVANVMAFANAFMVSLVVYHITSLTGAIL